MRKLLLLGLVGLLSADLLGQTISIDTSISGRKQEIDGFGTCISSSEGQQPWWQNVFFDDLGASILRIDLVPRFKSPWSDRAYNSPWFLGRDNQPFAFNLEIDSSAAPRYYVGAPADEFVTRDGLPHYNGPEGNRARTYSDAASYQKMFGNEIAPIAVMGPNIDDNIARCFDLNESHANTANAILAAAKQRDPNLARFKLVGALWSPAPWLKLSSGASVSAEYGSWPRANQGTPLPCIALGGNFVGGKLDTSGLAIPQFDDSSLPAAPVGDPNASEPRGPTSALTQFARSTAAYLRALQNKFGARFYAISIQNELNFETFYNSCTYRLSSEYIAALKAVRAELNKYADLRDTQIMGPEDLLGDTAYGLWQFGGGADTTHKNLQYLRSIGNDPAALSALGLFCIHGYAADGVSSAGGTPTAWSWWADGWSSPPDPGVPANVSGFTRFNKKSWMTETSGEPPAWLAGSGFPAAGGFGIAIKIHQALTAGQQSGWVYWQMTDGNAVDNETLTDSSERELAPKLVAMRHFARFIRPGAIRVNATPDSDPVNVSAYLHAADGTLTVVLINLTSATRTVTVNVPRVPASITQFASYTSSDNNYWKSSTISVAAAKANVPLPGYGVVTLVGQGGSASTTGGATTGGGGGGVDPMPVTGDFDGDGNADLLIRQRKILSFVPVVNFKLQTPVSLPFQLAKGERIAAAGDFDGDEIADIVKQKKTLATVLRVDGQGDPLNAALQRGDEIVATGDVNGDGFLDLVVQQKRSVFYFPGPTLTERVPLAAQLARKEKVLAVAALGGSDDLDVLKFNKTSATPIFGPDFVSIGSPFAFTGKPVGAADYNGDGIADIVTQEKELALLRSVPVVLPSKRWKVSGPR